MPQINLFSPNLNKKIGKSSAFEMSKVEVSSLSRSLLVAVLPLVAVLTVISLLLIFLVGKKAAYLRRVEQKESSLSVDPQELIRLNKRKSSLNKKIDLLTELSSQRFSWEDKLTEISDSLPNGVWLTEINVSSARIVSADTKQQKTQNRQKLHLVIKGSAIAPQIDNAVSFVGEFVNSLKQNKSFTHNFEEIKLNSVYKSSIGKSDVMNFEIECFSFLNAI